MEIKRKLAFTLVELIVVITILAILWTISYISLQLYSKDARNSIRTSDIRSMEKVFSLYQLRKLNFPTPTNPEGVTYLWSQVWTQWTFWEETRSSIWWRNISNVPLDPLTWSEYAYSVLNTWNEYEIATVFEGNLANNLNLIDKSYAAWKLWSTYIKWNYNWQIAKVSTWSIEYVLALPSIIKWQTTSTDILDIINNKKLTFNWSNNLPLSYSWTTNFEDKTISWDIVKANNLVVFEWNLNNLVGSSNLSERKTFLENLQQAYTGTLVSDIGSIESIMRLDITDANATENLALTLVNNNLWVAITSSSDWGSTPPPITSSSDWGSTPPPITDWRSVDSNCDIADVTVWTQTWAWCNSTLWTWIEYTWNWACFDYLSNDIWWTTCYWYNTKEITYNSIYGINNIWWKLYTWTSLDTDSDNDIDSNDTNKVCWTWYHVPTDSEWTTLENTLNGSSCRTWDVWECDWLGWKNHTTETSSNNVIEALKLPLAGSRNSDGSTFYGRGVVTYLWSSNLYASSASSRGLFWYFSTVERFSRSKAYGFSVRCIKD